MENTVASIIRYLKKKEKIQEDKISEVKTAIDQLDNAIDKMKKKNEKYFYITLGGLVVIFAVVTYYG